jgi:hypothetical protein
MAATGSERHLREGPKRCGRLKVGVANLLGVHR